MTISSPPLSDQNDHAAVLPPMEQPPAQLHLSVLEPAQQREPRGCHSLGGWQASAGSQIGAVCLQLILSGNINTECLSSG